MSSKYINSKFVYQQEGIDYADDHYIDGLLQTHLQNALLEIDSLKTQVNCLREALLNTIMYRAGTVNYGDPLEALESTPEQCLAEVKAKAIEDAAKKCGVKNIDGTYCWVDSLQDVAKQLREQAK